MTVDGYLELYTTLFGWAQYNQLWKLLNITGLVYLPFLGILLRNFMEPYQSQDAGDASATSVRRMEVDLVVALTVVVLAGQPFMTLDPTILSYNQPCTPDTAKAGTTGTTFDASFGTLVNETPSQVPIWWYAVMAFASGTTNAAISTVSCSADLIGHIKTVRTTQISDPAVLNEVAKFTNTCWVPAKAKFKDDPNITVSSTVANELRNETEWIGSKIFLETTGYYDTLRAKEPVAGWAYDPVRDTEYPNPLPAGYDAQNSGMPTCNEWWSDPTQGLRKKVIASIPPTVWDQARNTLSEFPNAPGYTQPDLEDNTLRNVLANSITAPPAVTPWNVSGGFSTLKDGELVSNLGATAGTLWESITFWPMVVALKSSLPMIQALILMGIYLLLPFIVVFSGYTLELLVMGAITLFTIKFWSYLWSVASWAENHLVKALFPDPGLFYLFSPSSSPDALLKRTIIAMLVALLYIGLPLIWSLLLGWLGIRGGSELASVVRQFQSPIQKVGSSGGNLAKSVITKMTK